MAEIGPDGMVASTQERPYRKGKKNKNHVFHAGPQDRRRASKSAFKGPKGPDVQPVRVYFVDPDTLK